MGAMLLSDGGIIEALESGALDVDSIDLDDIQPSSVDVHLGDELLVYPDGVTVIDPSAVTPMRSVPIVGHLDLAPGEFALASTREAVRLGATLAARVEGKSSLGRCGLAIHTTAGWIDPGFEGTVTLELSNVSGRPIRLRAGMPIGQLCVYWLDAPARRPYGSPGLRSRYQGQRGVTAARTLIV